MQPVPIFRFPFFSGPEAHAISSLQKVIGYVWGSICKFKQGSPCNLPKMDGKALKILATMLKGHIFGTKGILG